MTELVCRFCGLAADGETGAPLIYAELETAVFTGDHTKVYACWNCRAEHAWKYGLPHPAEPFSGTPAEAVCGFPCDCGVCDRSLCVLAEEHQMDYGDPHRSSAQCPERTP